MDGGVHPLIASAASGRACVARSSRRGLVAVIAIAAAGAAWSCSPAGAGPQPSTGSTPLVATSSLPLATTQIRLAPLTPRDPARIPPDEARAVVALGETDATEPDHAHGHTFGGKVLEYPLLTGDAAVFQEQWLAARRAAPRLDTVEEAAALGYVRAAVPAPGVGTHWVKWSLVSEPFDPAAPAILLIDEAHEPPRLVGYAYWLQSPDEPEGFAGSNDHWHQHTGICVVNGWVDREVAGGRERCAGTYLPGSDLWMLHAWPVERMPNPLGKFADVHPTLCPSRFGTPDVAQCPTG